ncbi:MAG: hypothetical protein AAF218_07710, partial [Pseudomonadota bacterium]
MKFEFSEEQKASLAKGFAAQRAGPKSWSGFGWLAWATLRSILDTNAVKAVSVWLFLVPILVSVTSEFPNKYSASPLNGDGAMVFVLDIPFNWYLLYFSAVSFGLSRAIYVIYCPEFIRKYGSSAAATSDGVTAELVKDYASDYLSSNARKLKPRSPEGSRLNSFLLEITGESNLVGQYWDHEGRKNLIQEIVAGAHIREIPGTGTYLRAFQLTGEEDENQKKLTSILLWRFIDWL